MYQSVNLWSLYPVWQINHNLTGIFATSEFTDSPKPTIWGQFGLGPSSTLVTWDWSGGHEILLCPPPTSISTPVGLFPHPFPSIPGIPGKVNTASPSGNPWGRVWLCTLNRLWSGRLLSKNRRHLGNLKTHTKRKVHAPRHLFIQENHPRERGIKVYWPFYQKSDMCRFYPQNHRVPFFNSLLIFYGKPLLLND